ncbi:hypothetical protein QJU43_03820 [Pasteurella atlantica]|uniref:hypothetical protein n=1 Tax=Pasteurellaceae TaxID=712 RepID=UPI00274F45AC|nr:hypothetical protein [Pasteurella atlantica]MDP8033537.1 hypothetical protein [Pasteurella atlantica]MDP8035472.1 hypothetical protein [Pasteurella atlantica]MDP8037423.1 hypothetical protein [Pasteurella atlantica]MDP8047772.1 hypothetical protein [Pasteurella atlantica]MDP8049667.1 hypothetical protein [Pasteurella atlantica]
MAFTTEEQAFDVLKVEALKAQKNYFQTNAKTETQTGNDTNLNMNSEIGDVKGFYPIAAGKGTQALELGSIAIGKGSKAIGAGVVSLSSGKYHNLISEFEKHGVDHDTSLASGNVSVAMGNYFFTKGENFLPCS